MWWLIFVIKPSSHLIELSLNRLQQRLFLTNISHIYANWSWFTVFHCFVQHSLHFKINWIFINKYKLISFIAVCFIFTVSISYCYFSGMIEKAGQDNNRNQKDSTNRKSVVVVDDDPSAQQKTGCCWHCCHSDANFFSSRKKEQASFKSWWKVQISYNSV